MIGANKHDKTIENKQLYYFNADIFGIYLCFL
jgi:hypothetical protein